MVTSLAPQKAGSLPGSFSCPAPRSAGGAGCKSCTRAGRGGGANTKCCRRTRRPYAPCDTRHEPPRPARPGQAAPQSVPLVSLETAAIGRRGDVMRSQSAGGGARRRSGGVTASGQPGSEASRARVWLAATRRSTGPTQRESAPRAGQRGSAPPESRACLSATARTHPTRGHCRPRSAGTQRGERGSGSQSGARGERRRPIGAKRLAGRPISVARRGGGRRQSAPRAGSPARPSPVGDVLQAHRARPRQQLRNRRRQQQQQQRQPRRPRARGPARR